MCVIEGAQLQPHVVPCVSNACFCICSVCAPENLIVLFCVWLEACMEMWCPLGEELLDAGYVAGDERLGKVVSFLAVQDLTCVEDFIGACACVHCCVCRA